MDKQEAMKRRKDSPRLKRRKTEFPCFVYYLGIASMTFPSALFKSYFMDIYRAIALVL